LKRWRDDGQIDLKQGIDLTDRTLLNQLDIYALIREYYYHVVTKAILRKQLGIIYDKHETKWIGHPASISIEKYNALSIWMLYYVNKKAKEVNYLTDFYYLVDLDVKLFDRRLYATTDPTVLEKFPYIISNRLVAYKLPWYTIPKKIFM
jgi:hypothetical protein